MPNLNIIRQQQSIIPTAGQILALSAAIVVAYVWLSLPPLAEYSLQAFAGCILLYFLLKRINQARLWELLPSTAVDEMTLVSFAFLLLVGGSQGTQSVFFPLIFVYLFFVSMTMNLITAIVISLETMIFFYALTPSATQLNLSHLFSIPVVMIFFLFAKYQYDQAQYQQNLAEIEAEEIHSYQVFLNSKTQQLDQSQQQTQRLSQYLISFIQHYLQPKLEQIKRMLDMDYAESTAGNAEETGLKRNRTSINQASIKGQLTLIEVQLEKVVSKLGNRKLEKRQT
jgi:hypothetical protein